MPVELREYRENNVIVTEYTHDGTNVSHRVEKPKQAVVSIEENQTISPSLEEQILFENKYQTMILEMGGM